MMDATDVRQFFVAVLQADPNLGDIDVSPDSNFDDLVIKPHMLFSQAIFNSIEAYKNTISLGNLESLTTAQLTAVAKYFGITPNTTSTLALQITIYLNASNNQTLLIQTTDSFRTFDGVVFNPIQSYVFIPSTLPTTIVNGQTLYVAQITVVSNNATSQITPNAITSYSINHPALVNVLNLAASPQPILADTNTQIIAKIQNGMFTRNLINRPSIFNGLVQAFPSDVVNIHSVGYGDPEMQRDIVPAGQAWSFHVGGTIDTYVRTSLQPMTYTTTANLISSGGGHWVYRFNMMRYLGFNTNSSASWLPEPAILTGWEIITGSNVPVLPLVYVDFASNTFSIGSLSKSRIVQNPTTKDYEVSIVSMNSNNFRYSIYEQLQVTITVDTYPGSDTPIVNLPYFTMASLEDIQKYISEPQTIFHCADNIVKSFIPIEIRDFTIKYDKNYTLDTAALTTTLCNIINSWNSPEHIRMSTLLSNVPAPVRIGEIGSDLPVNPSLLSADPQITAVPSKLLYDGQQGDANSLAIYNALPTYVEVVQHNIDGSVNHFITTDQICSLEQPALSATRRTVSYFIQPENVTFLPISW
jgi:hypothetical protein